MPSAFLRCAVLWTLSRIEALAALDRPHPHPERGRFVAGLGPAGHALVTLMRMSGVSDIILVRPSGDAPYERT